MTGVYEQIINTLFKEKLKKYTSDKFYIGKRKIGKDEATLHLSQYLYRIIQKVFELNYEQGAGVDKFISIANTIIKTLAKELVFDEDENDLIIAENTILTSVIEKASIDSADVIKYLEDITPVTSLTKSTLFTGKNASLSLGSELKREILSSDRIDIIVSFIKKSGLSLIYDELKTFTKAGKQLRVITTTYMCASDYDAIVKLSKLTNTEIKISYNCDTDRLHAKAYIFIRNSGFSTAFVGSSNLSNPALKGGLEWNLKATQRELPEIVAQMLNTFESYWQDPSFETFTNGEDNERLLKALNGDKGDFEIDYSVLDLIKAKEYQNEILEKLDVERDYHNHWRNLVVAATGTGKTVISAFDYKRFKERRDAEGKTSNLLFIVHREEIIKQACSTFRYVLGDENFGEMWYGGHEATNYSHLFASKDLFNNRIDSLSLPDDYYDYIIIDEAHHIVAPTYQKVLARFKPTILLGLTATPERMDGQDIQIYFDGHISAEIRLDTALNNQLLSPFHYYGVTDSVDYSELKWERGRYEISELTKILTYNDRRTGVILKAIETYAPNFNQVKALCFCVGQEHAKYMHAKFTLAGLKSAALTSDNNHERSLLLTRLREGSINYLFVVDMFNEGVDVPEIDTVLFLRPTESLTIFLQQFGRGLRKAPGKEYLTVLDFVGMSRAEFNFTDRFRALIGRTSMSVNDEVRRDFPHMPLGCSIHLEEKAKEYILDNIRANLTRCNRNNLVRLIRDFGRDYDVPLTLGNFTRRNHISLEDIYKRGMTWSQLCCLAQTTDVRSGLSEALSRAVSNRWLSVDSFSYFSFLKRLADSGFAIKECDLDDTQRTMSLMMYYDLFKDAGQFKNLQQMFDALSADAVFVAEMRELTPLLIERCEALESDDNSVLRNFPLKLHGIYTKSQIHVALGTSTIDKASSCREGVERTVFNGRRVEAMFVDIIKDREADSSTNYNDFALSNDLFQWETQNAVSQSTEAGRNYINKTHVMLLFVRKQAKDPETNKRTMGYVYLGEVTLVNYEGGKPMKIVWKLKTPMPGSTYDYATKYLQAI